MTFAGSWALKYTRTRGELLLVITHADRPVTEERARRLVDAYRDDLLRQVIQTLENHGHGDVAMLISNREE